MCKGGLLTARRVSFARGTSPTAVVNTPTRIVATMIVSSAVPTISASDRPTFSYGIGVANACACGQRRRRGARGRGGRPWTARASQRQRPGSRDREAEGGGRRAAWARAHDRARARAHLPADVCHPRGHGAQEDEADVLRLPHRKRQGAESGEGGLRWGMGWGRARVLDGRAGVGTGEGRVDGGGQGRGGGGSLRGGSGPAHAQTWGKQGRAWWTAAARNEKRASSPSMGL